MMSPRTKARIAGLFYLLTFVTGGFALAPGAGVAANLVATAVYVVVVLLFYSLFKPVGRALSLITAIVGLWGCAYGVVTVLDAAPFHINSLAFFGFYCLLVGYLILRSKFLPGVLGVLMVIGGLGWLTFFIPSLVSRLRPYNFAPGMIGEGALTLWLLIRGVNASRWEEQASRRVTLNGETPRGDRHPQ